MKKIYLALALIGMVTGCKKQNEEAGGIIFTFDDQYIDQWYNFREQFIKYNIKATFFINRPQLLNQEQIEKLKQLSKDGHEIGCHGLNHLNALDFKDSLVASYYKTEVKPATEILNGLGFEVNSFAYPYGTSTDLIDKDINSHLPYLRKATYNMRDTTIDNYNEIYANVAFHHIVSSMGIDRNYNISLENIETGMKRALKNNEVLVLHAHRISTTNEDYSVDPEFLKSIFQLSKTYNLRSIRFCDLESYFTSAP